MKPVASLTGPREVRQGVPPWAKSAADSVAAWTPAGGAGAERGPSAEAPKPKPPGQPKSRAEKRPRAQVPSRPQPPIPPPPGQMLGAGEAAPPPPQVELPPGAIITTQEELEQHEQQVIDLLREPYLLAAERLDEARNELVSRLHEDIVDLAARLAAVLLQREVKLDRTLIVDVVQRALRLAGPLEHVTIKCNADDAELLRERAPGLARAETGRPVEVTVRPSDDIQPGGCVLTWEGGVVDARNERRLERIVEAVKAAVAE
ncbi:MAG: FliH/SctL family protein [Myxococcota bacterium]